MDQLRGCVNINDVHTLAALLLVWASGTNVLAAHLHLHTQWHQMRVCQAGTSAQNVCNLCAVYLCPGPSCMLHAYSLICVWVSHVCVCTNAFLFTFAKSLLEYICSVHVRRSSNGQSAAPP